MMEHLLDFLGRLLDAFIGLVIDFVMEVLDPQVRVTW